MSETVAVALITGGLVILAGVVTQLVAAWLEQGHRSHERAVRLLEWKRADRVERLAPIREFLDAASREGLNLAAVAGHVRDGRATGAAVAEIEAVQTWLEKRSERLLNILEEEAYVVWRSSDARLTSLLLDVLKTMERLIPKQEAPPDETAKRLERTIQEAWDRLEELQSAL